MDFPEALARAQGHERVLDGLRENLVQSQDGTLVREERIRLRGYPGRRVIFRQDGDDGEPALSSVAIYLVPPKVYQLQYTGDGQSLRAPAVQAWFESFELVGVPDFVAATGEEVVSWDGGFRIRFPPDLAHPEVTRGVVYLCTINWGKLLYIAHRRGGPKPPFRPGSTSPISP